MARPAKIHKKNKPNLIRSPYSTQGVQQTREQDSVIQPKELRQSGHA